MDTAGSAAGTSSIYVPLEDDPDTTGGASSSSPASWGIRCLTLEPGKGDDPVRCELIASHLGKIGGRYEALSYTWGDSSLKFSILLNGQPFDISGNLYSALLHLRRPDSGRTLWIDALCINQADIPEVNRCVRRMWAIYEKARNVVVFLGESNKRSEQAFRLLLELSCLPSEASDRHGQITKLLRDTEMASRWNALRHIMQRPWWDRAWIVQEYAVAQKVIFLCGKSELGGDEFQQAMEYLIDYKYNAIVPQNWLQLVRLIASTPISHLLTIRSRYQLSGADPSLGALDVLYRSRGSKASDPRDKVYSFFRLISENPMLQPDYNRPIQDLYRGVVEAMIESSGTLEVLCHHNRGILGIPGLPSWCPDWSVMHGKRLMLYTKKYSAAGSSRAQARIDGDVLTLKGRTLDRIKWLSSPFESSDFKRSKALYANIMDIGTTALKKSALRNRQGVSLSKVFRETLVSSRMMQRGPDGWKTRVLDSITVENMWKVWSSSLGRANSLNGEGRNLAKAFEDALHSTLHGRAFFVSQQGYFGIVDRAAQVGDLVVVLLGGTVLFALHETECETDRATGGPESTYSEYSRNYHLIGEW